MAKCRPNASVVAFSPTAPCAGQLHGSISGHVLARRQPRNAGVCEPLRRNRRVREPLNNAWRCERIGVSLDRDGHTCWKSMACHLRRLPQVLIGSWRKRCSKVS
ncbi:hypothetical protein FDU21_11155 [Xanthomonas oryzae pv. oryzae]|nr:hypothetical protein FDU21_11155 [Xanthomonas oryzae pv. oryzae]